MFLGGPWEHPSVRAQKMDQPKWTPTIAQSHGAKTSATLHGNAPAQDGTNATLHGNAFRLRMVHFCLPKVSAAYWKIKHQSAKTETHHLPTLHGNAIS